MSKSIKVNEEVYQKLLLMQRPRETFSELIQRLLFLSELLEKVGPLISGQRTELQKQFVRGLNAKKVDRQGG